MSTTEQVTPTAATVHPSAISSNARPDTTQKSDSNPSQNVGSEKHDEYPEQKHAGKVGYGPQYHSGPTFTDKVTGLKEVVKGKITGNQGLVRQGQERQTGELMRKKKQADMDEDPFAKQETDHKVAQDEQPSEDSRGTKKS
ncbi:uncharacterized protein BT62DRAFT_584833 [Guyanagaster necrorhizus]|uniref:Uncharacterized protein n=1 Tax=Guyanagaster necrorhizus TaxID=856835 RepID=A0A9P7VI51_9AGAR|nr:uncharacterized protein BT62DRAFT_584833 [Guyanagaster necrorhizus MCA 3950]KAG7440471.1 hypothetical protein BT62DRAFT_584833 [Guyanagaster necrorhizus MCA 3950]